MRNGYIGLVVLALTASGCGDGGGGPPTGGSQTGTITGQVVDADSGSAGMSGVSVQLTRTGGTQTVTTSASGSYTLANAAVGSWQLTLQLPGTHRLPASETGTRTVNVTANQTTTVPAFQLARPKGHVSGTATSQGAAVAGGSVVASRTGFTGRNATPGATGFTISDLPVGAWSLAYTPPATHQLAGGESGTRTATVTEGQTTSVSAFLLQPVPPGTVVEIHLNGTSFVPSTVTIAAGTRVRWVNDGGDHTVTPQNTSQPGVWQEQTTSTPGTVFEHTFTVSGQQYRYRCVPHSSDFNNGMVGVITVT